MGTVKLPELPEDPQTFVRRVREEDRASGSEIGLLTHDFVARRDAQWAARMAPPVPAPAPFVIYLSKCEDGRWLAEVREPVRNLAELADVILADVADSGVIATDSGRDGDEALDAAKGGALLYLASLAAAREKLPPEVDALFSIDLSPAAPLEPAPGGG